MNHLHVSLSPEAKERLVGYRSASGKTLRQSLICSMQSEGIATTTHPSLFSTAIEVDDDVPAIIGAVSMLTNRSVEELVETWLLEDPASVSSAAGASEASAASELSEAVLGKVAQVLDLGETLIEQGFNQQRAGCSADELKSVANATAEMFRALRLLLGLTEPADSKASQ